MHKWKKHKKIQKNVHFVWYFKRFFLKLLCCLNYIYNFANRKTQVILQGNEV